MNFRLGLWILLLAVTLVRYLVALSGGVTPEEAYFWLLGGHWEWASFEGPGGLPAVVAFFSGALGPHVEVLRLLGPLWALLASLGLWWWGKNLGGTSVGIWAMVAWNVLPGVNYQTLFFGPDLLLATLWIWFLAVAWKGEQSKRGAGWWFLLAGGIGAAGCLVSYWMLLAPAGLLLHRAASLAWQRCASQFFKKSASEDAPPKRRRKVFWLAILLPLAGLAGPFQWNVESTWVAFAGQTWQSLTTFGAADSWSAIREWFFFAGFAVAPTAVVVFFAMLAFRDSATRWLLGQVLLPFCWLLWCFWNGRETLPAWLIVSAPLMIFAAWKLRDRQWNESGVMAGWLRPVGFALLALAALVSAWVLATSRPGSEEPDWAALAARVERVARIYQPAGSEPPFLVAGTGEEASALGFHLLLRDTGSRRDFPPVFLRESQNLANQFGLWPRYDEFISRTGPGADRHFTEQKGFNRYLGEQALYFGKESPEELPQVIRNGFTRVLPLETIQDRTGRKFYLYLCEDYLTAPL